MPFDNALKAKKALANVNRQYAIARHKEGLSTSQIASILGVSQRMVQKYLKPEREVRNIEQIHNSVVALKSEKKSISEISRLTGYSRTWIYEILKKEGQGNDKTN